MTTQNKEAKSRPLVGVVMGSPNDAKVMERVTATLERLGITCESVVRSAHRMPVETAEYARTARERGLRVLVAGAGMAAHLAGALAAQCTLPVIGVPLASGALHGQDALFATVQMPSGVPVATVAIDGAENAGYLAAQILALGDPALTERLESDREERRRKLLAGAH